MYKQIPTLSHVGGYDGSTDATARGFCSKMALPSFTGWRTQRGWVFFCLLLYGPFGHLFFWSWAEKKYHSSLSENLNNVCSWKVRLSGSQKGKMKVFLSHPSSSSSFHVKLQVCHTCWTSICLLKAERYPSFPEASQLELGWRLLFLHLEEVAWNSWLVKGGTSTIWLLTEWVQEIIIRS